MSFEISNRVKVVWEDSGTTFLGVVTNISYLENEKVYDVLYDATVRGKACLEKNITIDRLLSISDEELNNSGLIIDISDEDEDEYNDDDNTFNQSNKQINSPQQRNGGIDTLTWLINIKNDDNEIDFNDIHLTLNHIKNLDATLTNNKVIDLFTKSPEILDLLFTLLNNYIINIELDISYNFEVEYNEVESSVSVAQWLKYENPGGFHLNCIESILLAGQLMITIMVTVSSYHSKSSSSLSLSEEVMEKILSVSSSFINNNALIQGISLKKSFQRSSSNEMKQHIDKTTNNLLTKSKSNTTKMLRKIGSIIFPQLRSIMMSLETILHIRRQSDRLCISTYELAIMILRIDIASNSRAILIDPGQGSLTESLLPGLHMASSQLLRTIFSKYPSHRSSILQELMSIFSQTYSVKSPSKCYILQDSSRLSYSFVTLMIMIQSVVLIPNNGNNINIHNKEDIELGKISLHECHRNSSIFIMDLFKRCILKETSVEYRIITSLLLDEIITSIQSPQYPVASILLDHFVRRLLNDLNSYLSLEVDSKKDATYITFAMDLLGLIGSKVREIMMKSDVESSNTSLHTLNILEINNKITLNSFIIEAISNKINENRLSWIALATNQTKERNNSNINNDIENELTNQKSKKNSKKKSKIVTSENNSIIQFDLTSSLYISAQIIKLSLEAIQQYNHMNKVKDEHKNQFMVPTAMNILELCNARDLIELFPEISPRDNSSYHVAIYLEYQINNILVKQLQHQQQSYGYDIDLMISEANLRDAYNILLSQWNIHSISTKANDTSTLTTNLLRSSSLHKENSNVSISGNEINLSSKQKQPSLGILTCISETIKNSSNVNYEFDSKGLYFSLECLNISIRSILSTGILNTLFEGIVSALLVLFSDPIPTARARAVKNLALIMAVDLNLIKRESILNAIIERFNDIAISVREETVKLVGSFVLKGFDVSDGYLDGLLVRLRDKGLSVKKAVVNIIREILVNQPNHPRYLELCINLLEKCSLPKEEDSIKEIIRSTFQQLWFLPPPPSSYKQANHVLQQQLLIKRNNSLTSINSNLSISDTSSVLSRSNSLTNSNSLSLSRSNSVSSNYGSSDNYGASGSSLNELKKDLLANGWKEILSLNNNNNKVNNKKLKSVSKSTPLSSPKSTPRSTPKNSPKSSPSKQRSLQSLVGNISNSNDSDANIEFISPDGVIFHNIEAALESIGIINSLEKLDSNIICNNNEVNMSTNEIEFLTKEEINKKNIEAIARQIVDIVSIFDNHQWIVTLIRDMLHGKGGGGEASSQVKQKRLISLTQCEQLVRNLIDLLLKAEENNKELMTSLQESKRTANQFLVSVVTALAVFSEAHPALVSKHIPILLPYLKGDSGLSIQEESIITLKIIDIITASMSVEGVYLGANIAVLASDLTQIALKFSGKTVDAAILCLARLTQRHLPDTRIIVNLGNKCLQAILTIFKTITIGNVSITQAQSDRLKRCLLVLGKVCEHIQKNPSSNGFVDWQLDVKIAKEKTINSIKDLQYQGIYGISFVVVKHILSNVPDVNVHVLAIQALCGIFIGCSRLMMVAEDENLIINLLNNNDHNRIQEKLLQSLKDMMISEESRLEAGQALKDMGETGVKIGEKQNADADTSVVGFVLQQHLPSILAFTSCIEANLRFAALELLGIMLRQGMICPLDVISQFVALQGDPEPIIRKEALKLLQTEDEKHPNFLDNRIVEGVELAYVFQMKILSTTRPVEKISNDNLGLNIGDNGEETVSISSIFTPLYISCIQSNRKRRNDFILGLLRRIHMILNQIYSRTNAVGNDSSVMSKATTIDNVSSNGTSNIANNDEINNESTNSSNYKSYKNKKGTTTSLQTKALIQLQPLSIKEATRLLDIVVFLTTTLAHLNFEWVEEPLQGIYWINRNCAISTSMLISTLRKELTDINLGAEDREEGTMQPPVFGTGPIRKISDESKETTTITLGTKRSSNITSSEESLVFIEKKLIKNYKQYNINTQNKLNVILLRSAEARGRESLLRLKSYWKAIYGINDEQCQSFSPDDKTIMNEKLKLFNTSSKIFTAIPLSSYQDLYESIITANSTNSNNLFNENIVMTIMKAVVIDYNRLGIVLEKDPEDFTLMIKKKRKIKSQIQTNNGDNKEKKRKKEKSVRKKKKTTIDSNEDNDDDNNDSNEDEYI